VPLSHTPDTLTREIFVDGALVGQAGE